MSGIVVIGGGQAGSSLVAKLRDLGFDGDLTLVCAEPVPPYQRPPLSKAYLLGEMELERLFLRPEQFYSDQNITLRLGQTATAIDPTDKIVTVGDDDLPYDQLAIVTGSVPHRLPTAIGGDLGGVFEIRTLADVDAAAPKFTAGARVLIVGGGYIGLEAAAVSAKLGLDVTLVEMADRILQRVACPETSAYFRALHQSHGVKILEGTGLERLAGDGHVSGAVLTDGTELAIDFALVGVGIAPSTALAKAAGLTIDNGIAVDGMGRTSDPSIWSAGDCASFPRGAQRIRLESVQNAIDQAECVAANMLGARTAYKPYPWFWSDQYEVKLQIAGLNTGYDAIVARPGAREGSTSHWYFEGDVLLAVDAMNDPRSYMIGKRMIEGGVSPKQADVANPDTDLKALMSG